MINLKINLDQAELFDALLVTMNSFFDNALKFSDAENQEVITSLIKELRNQLNTEVCQHFFIKQMDEGEKE